MAANANPVPYIGTGGQAQTVLGHYSLAQKSGAVTGTIAANANLAGFRWAPVNPNIYSVMMRIKVSIAVTTVLSTASPVDIAAFIARGFTVDFTTNNTQANLAAVVNTNTMRASMAPSQLTTKGPNILTTAAMTGQTATLDANAFAMATMNLPSTAAVGQADSRTLYEWTALGQHPPVLSNNMGIILQNPTATSFGTGVVPYYVVWEWAEVLLF